MNLTCIAFGTLFFLTGILFAHGKLHTRTDAWKRMPKEEQEKIELERTPFHYGCPFLS